METNLPLLGNKTLEIFVLMLIEIKMNRYSASFSTLYIVYIFRNFALNLKLT
jgi:hypothetical protein